MIIKPEVFEDSRLPRELKYREREIETLSRALDPALAGKPADDILLAGPSGVGKTALARFTLDRLDQFVHVPHTHIRCLGETTGAILRTALTEFPGPEDAPVNMPVDRACQELRETVDRPVVVTLDEADDLPETDVLDALSSVPMVSIVAICHDPQSWLARAPDDVRQDIVGPVHVERFSTGELASILRDRATQGLRPNVVSDDQLREIADEVAGAARDGIQALRAAATLASDRQHTRIQDVDVADSFERAQRRIRASNLRSLPFHHHVLYHLIYDAGGELTAGELHGRYDERAEGIYLGRDVTPIGRRARRYKLQKLRKYDLIEWGDETQPRVYRVVDPSVEPRLDRSVPSA